MSELLSSLAADGLGIDAGTTPGLFSNVPADAYHTWPEVSPSRAKHAIESALAYKSALETPFKPTDAMDLGTACHFAVWEPDLLPLRCVVWEGERRAGKEWQEFLRANRGKLILKLSAYQTVCKVRDRCQKHPAIRSILARDGDREVSMRWEREADGGSLQCKGRVDYLADRIYDLKTAYCIDDRAVTRAVVDRFIHGQMAAYRDGYQRVRGEELTPVLIFAQTKPPYDARVMKVEGPELARGQELWRTACDVIARARKLDRWDGMAEEEQSLLLPLWALNPDGKAADDEMELTLDGESIEV